MPIRYESHEDLTAQRDELEDALAAALKRAESAEASTALLRQALQFYADHTNWASYDGVYLAPFDRWTDSGMNGYDTAEEALKATDAGQSLLDELQQLRAKADLIPESVAAPARVIGLHLERFCDKTQPWSYYEMIAEASRRAGAHIRSLEEQVQQLTLEHGAMKRRLIGRPDWRCMKCGHYASGSGQWACSSCGEWHTWESVGNHNWHPDSPQGRAWLEPVTARFEAWLQKEADLDKLKEVSTNE